MSLSDFFHFDHPHEAGRTVKVGACHRDPQRPEHTHYDASQWGPDDLPAFVDLRPHLTPVEDQGDLGSCTANALAGAIEYLEKRLADNGERVSRLFLYWNERDLEGKAQVDAGACLDDGVRALKRDGVCSEKVWPYDPKRVFHKPHDEAYDDAEPHTIDEAHRVKIDLHHLRHCLAEGYPFVFGLVLHQSWDKARHGGKVAMPRPGEKEAGGHAMLCVGYSDKDQVFVVRNSWGPKWGDGGYCYVPYAYLSDPKFAHDAWTLRRAHDLDFNQGAGEAESPHGSKESFFEEDDEAPESEGAEAEEGDEAEDQDESEEGDEAGDDEGEAAEGEDEEGEDAEGEDAEESEGDPAAEADEADGDDPLAALDEKMKKQKGAAAKKR